MRMPRRGMRMPGRAPKARGKRAALSIAAALLLAAPSATAAPLDLETVAELAAAADNQSEILRRRLDDQLDDLGLSGYLDGVSLRLNGSVGDSAATGFSASGSAVLSAGIEILPQLTVSASLATTGTTAETMGGGDPISGTLGLTLDPFADPTGREREELEAEVTATDLATARASAAHAAIGALIDAVSARMQLELLEAQQEVAERSLATVASLHERDRATDQQLALEEDSVRRGAQRLASAELSLDRALEVLARAIGLSAASVEVPLFDDMDLEHLLAAAGELAQSAIAEGLAETDPAVIRSLYDVRLAQLEVDSAHRFTPRASVTVSGALAPASGGLSQWSRGYELSAEFSVSPSDWDGTAVSEAETDLAFAGREYEHATRVAAFDAASAINELQFSLDDLEAAREDLSEAEQDFSEAEFRFERGDITELKLDQAYLSVLEATNEVNTSVLEVLRRHFAILYIQY